MSFNVYNGKNINVGCYIRSSGLPMQAPMILPPEFGEMPKDFDDYDYDHPDTIKLFGELGQEERIARMRARQPIKDEAGHGIRYE